MQKLIHVYLIKRLHRDNRNTCAYHGKNVRVCVCVCVCEALCLNLAGRASITFSHCFLLRNNSGEWEDECHCQVYPLSVWDRTDQTAAMDLTVQLSAL